MLYKKLLIWQKSVNLSLEIYKITSIFPNDERFGLISQIRRCVISIASNISEGYCRNSRKSFKYFLSVSRGSLSELDTQLLISYKLGYLEQNIYERLTDKIVEIDKMINGLIKKIR